MGWPLMYSTFILQKFYKNNKVFNMIPTRLYADSMAISTLFYMFYMFLCVIKGKNIIFEKIFVFSK